MNTKLLINRVGQFIKDNQLIAENDRLVIAVSGGADSVGLVYILYELQEYLSCNLFLCHLNHKIRGKDADEDERYCKELAERLKLKIYCESQDVTKICKTQNESLELTARNVRYDFYRRACNFFSASKIALAHHQDDQCETIIFNMIRGCNIHGLRGIPVRRILKAKNAVEEQGNENLKQTEIIRPLLCCTKAELEHFLRSKNIDWRIDKTNYELKASRNIIRHQILPAMEKINPSAKEHLLQIASQSAYIEAIIDEQANKILADCIDNSQTTNEVKIEKRRIETIPEIIACEVVRKMILSLGAGLRHFSFKHFRTLIDLRDTIDLPAGLRAKTEGNWLIISRQNQEKSQNELTYKLQISHESFNFEKFKEFCRTKTKFEEMIDADKVIGELEIRLAQTGERFCPLGMPGSKKIGDFLTDVKAKKSDRPGIVVNDAKSIIWLVGWRIDERVKITEATKNVLILKAIRKEQLKPK